MMHSAQSTVQTVNVLGEVVEVEDNLKGKVNYQYDAQGNLTLTTTTAHSSGGGTANGVPTSIDILAYL